MFIKYLKLALIVFTISFGACDFESDNLFLNETTEDYQLYDYYVDDYGNEGIVAYIYNSSNSSRRYILVISLDETFLSWGPMDLLVYDCDSLNYTAFLTEKFPIAMLQSMKSLGIERFPAQEWCDKKNAPDSYPYGGSWHLPSRDELLKIFSYDGHHLSSLNSALYNTGGTLIHSEDYFWTCVEDFDDYITIGGQSYDYDKKNRAIIMTPTNSTTSDKNNWIKKTKHHVRAVKYIYYRYN